MVFLGDKEGLSVCGNETKKKNVSTEFYFYEDAGKDGQVVF